jgi:hypothetical protein
MTLGPWLFKFKGWLGEGVDAGEYTYESNLEIKSPNVEVY